MTPEQRFADVVEALRGEPNVTEPSLAPGRRFGDGGMKVNGKIFAMLVGGRLVVKLPGRQVDGLVEAAQGQRFDPGHGRVMKEWLSLADDSSEDWVALARQAMEFVRGR